MLVVLILGSVLYRALPDEQRRPRSFTTKLLAVTSF
jgi:hypothetical protein